MIREARVAILVAKAKDAQTEADKAKAPLDRELWLKIAQAYRDLAQRL